MFTQSCTFKQKIALEDKGQLYHSKSGIVKLIKLSKDSSIKELAALHNVGAEEIASANGVHDNTIFKAGHVVRIPFFIKNQGESVLLDEERETPIRIDSSSIGAIDDNEDLGVSDDISDLPIKAHDDGGFRCKSPMCSNQFIWPLNGKVIMRYGQNGENFHEGINIEAPQGMAVRSIASGEVVYTGNEPNMFGYLVIIKHKNNYLSAYAHNEKILVRSGDQVKQGDIIATVGQTGAVDRPQLHLSMRKGKVSVNPDEMQEH
ncbi:MAG: M23 family metallopeptidase [Proteobacteria bacterium]|nr:M23 family metallopeptidase [Pseudomonadota bacterium]